MPADTSWPVRPIPTWRLLALLLGATALVVGYIVAGMPGMDHGTGESGHLEVLSPAQFEAALAADDVLVVNVHVPYEGEIGGTDLFIPYTEISTSASLPDDFARPILLYCRSGRMSETAGHALIEAGYSDVAHLAGGTDAWVTSGRQLLDNP